MRSSDRTPRERVGSRDGFGGTLGCLRRRNANFSAKDVETLPARPRHPPQALEGGTSLVTSTAYRTTRTWDEAMLSLPKLSPSSVWVDRTGLSASETSRLPGPADGIVDGLGTSLHLRPAFFCRAPS